MGPWGALISLNTDTRTQSSAQPSIRDSASPGTSATLHVFWSTYLVGWGVFWGQGGRRAGFWHPASEKDRGEVCVFVAVAGKGLSCPARGGCEVVSQSGTRGPFCGASPGLGTQQPRPGLPLVPPGPALWPSSLESFLECHSGHTCLSLVVTPAWHCALLARFLYWELGP